ncbi:hypothetical protein RclHR1_04020023 [Rhizophagus clarus]|nr:hypothetical protein RclHR1_04020023 [Rhizophagus clarus]
MQELSKGNDELTFVIDPDKLVIKTTTTSSLSILVTLYRKLFDSFQMRSPKIYTIFSTSIRDIFSRATTDLSSLRIIIEESGNLSEEDLVIFEICRKMCSIQSKHNIFCNNISLGISDINDILKPLNEAPSSEENHWSINSKDLKECWPQNCKNDTIRFLFALDNLKIINLTTSDDEFVSESRYPIPGSKIYKITNPVDIRINRKSFERVMYLICSLKCNLNAHFSDLDSDDVYQPQPFYLCGEIERYIKIEGKISGSHMEYGNQPERHWEIESALNASSQIEMNSSDEIEYQPHEAFLQDSELSNSYSTVSENYMPVRSDNTNTSNPICTYDNSVNHNRININNLDNGEVSSMSNFPVDSINNVNRNWININNWENREISNISNIEGHGSSSFLTPGEDISRRLESIRFGDNRVNSMKRNFSATGLGDDMNNDESRTIRPFKVFNQD